MPPADEGRKVALYVFIGIGVSFAIFASMRMFAKPAPATMTKEYQEQTNEYVKVCSSQNVQHSYVHLLIPSVEPTRRASYRYLGSWILRSRHGSIAAQALSVLSLPHLQLLLD